MSNRAVVLAAVVFATVVVVAGKLQAKMRQKHETDWIEAPKRD